RAARLISAAAVDDRAVVADLPSVRPVAAREARAVVAAATSRAHVASAAGLARLAARADAGLGVAARLIEWGVSHGKVLCGVGRPLRDRVSAGTICARPAPLAVNEVAFVTGG